MSDFVRIKWVISEDWMTYFLKKISGKPTITIKMQRLN